MNERKIRLRDLRRAIEDYRYWKNELEACDLASWDGKVAAFKDFLCHTPVVGDQLFSLAKQTADDIRTALLKVGIYEKIYSPPCAGSHQIILHRATYIRERWHVHNEFRCTD